MATNGKGSRITPIPRDDKAAKQPEPLLDQETTLRMVDAYCSNLLENAYNNFKDRPAGTAFPNGTTWENMKIAMLVYQQVKVADSAAKERVWRAVANAPIGRWGALIVEAVAERSITDIMQAGV